MRSQLLPLVLVTAAGIAQAAARAEDFVEPSCPPPPPALQPSEQQRTGPRVAGRNVVPDPGCWISAKQAADEERTGPLTWVDVRPAARVRTHPITAALQIPLAELAGKKFLRGESLVLVGTGFDQAALGEACRSLRSAGFQRVRALERGVFGWHMAGRLVGGNGFFGDEIAPEELPDAAGSSSLITIGLDAEGIAQLPSKPAQSLPALTGPALADRITAQSKKQERLRPVVLIAPNAEGTRALKASLSAQLPSEPLLWLHGGLDAYLRHIEQQHQITSNFGRPLRRRCGA